MQPRRNVIDKFSAFLILSKESQTWMRSPKLRRSMERVIKQSDEDSNIHFWESFWCNQIHTEKSKIATEHLYSYLQETCYWESLKIHRSFPSLNSEVEDLFGMTVPHVRNAIQKYNPNVGSRFSSYAAVVVKHGLHEELRKNKEVELSSKWGLLRKITRKKLNEALNASGLSQNTIEQYLLAWKSFKELYIPSEARNTRKLSGPDTETWQTIARDYNSRRMEELPVNTASASSAELTEWMEFAADSIRSYLTPVQSSLDKIMTDEGETTLLNLIADEDANPMELAINELDAQLLASNKSELAGALAEIDTDLQQVLELWLGKQVRQTDIAKQLNIEQYQVARKIKKARKEILRKLAERMSKLSSEKDVHIQLSSSLLKECGHYLDAWLSDHFAVSEDD